MSNTVYPISKRIPREKREAIERLGEDPKKVVSDTAKAKWDAIVEEKVELIKAIDNTEPEVVEEEQETPEGE